MKTYFCSVIDGNEHQFVIVAAGTFTEGAALVERWGIKIHSMRESTFKETLEVKALEIYMDEKQVGPNFQRLL